MNALELVDLKKSYGKNEVLHGVNLEIPKGQFFGLLGQNGAGKSTIINCTTGIGKITSGGIKVFEKDVVSDYQETRKMIGLSPQEFNVDIFAKITKVLDYVGGYFDMPKKEREERIEEMLEKFDLTSHKDKQFRQLSGGLKRRVMLARALMHNPDLLILDEPTAGVDVEQRHELWQHLKDLHTAGKTIILTSHYIEEVEYLCERVAVLHEGEIKADLNASEFKNNGDNLEAKYLKLTKKEK